MEKKRGTVGTLIDGILNNRGISVDQFCEMYDFKRSTIFRRMQTDSPIEDVEFKLIRALAEVGQTTAADIYMRLGIDVNEHPPSDKPPRFENLRLGSLERNIQQRPALQKAITIALRGHEAWLNGDMTSPLTAYQAGLRDAQRANAVRHAAYLKMYLIKFSEMTGNLSEAGKYFHAVQEDADHFRSVGQKTKDNELLAFADRLTYESQLYWLWANRWFHGVSEASITEGEALLDDLERQHLYILIPNNYIFLARCAVAMGDGERALQYIERARIHALAASHTQLASTALYLDPGGDPPRTQQEFRWLNDLIRGAKVDILVSLGRFEEALATYLTIQSQRSPCAQWSFFNWFDPRWQRTIRQQSILTSEEDVKIDLSFDDWDSDLEDGGNIHIQALNLYAQGKAYTSQGDLLKARLKFNAVQYLLSRTDAQDLLLRSSLANCMVAHLERKKTVAVNLLNMVEEKIHRISNPVILTEFQQAQEAIRQM